MARLRAALCQINPVVGDIAANTERILAALATAADADCDVAVFPEMAVTGYPPEDLLLKRRFLTDSRQAMQEIAARTDRCAAVVGFADGDGGEQGCANAAGVAAGGRLLGVYHKRELPNYGVFDEQRWFRPGTDDPLICEMAGVSVGVVICEDAWVADGPVARAAALGADVVLVLNASPFHVGKQQQRLQVLRSRVAEVGCTIVYVNLVGGQDELVFDGGSFVMDVAGEVTAQARSFAEQVLVVDVATDDAGAAAGSVAVPVAADTAADPDAQLCEQYQALVLATRDYVRKNGFSDVGVGLSGGIDSSLVAALATEALGPERVHGVLMPSRFSSDHSLSDAEALCQNLGIQQRVIPIEPAHEALLHMLAPSFVGRDPDTTEENLQSRIRGLLLMALSNKFGWLILTTGNKSESAVGYSTLYGDTAGGYAVIKDLWKLQVYALAEWCNTRAGREIVPTNVLTKPPSAELRPDQRDDQSLPPYEVLDPILEAYVEHDLTEADLMAAGHEPDLVARIVRLVDLAEYKRRQNPPGVRITPKAFGRDRRLPITNRYRGES